MVKRSTYLLMMILLLSSACRPALPTQVSKRTKPALELVTPPSGVRVPLHEELEVESRSTDTRGLRRIELWVDDGLYRVDEVGGQQSFHVIQRWRADTSGQHRLRVQAVNVDGQTSEPATITVEVPDPSLFTATPTLIPTMTPVPSDTPTVTATPPVAPSTYTPTAVTSPAATAAISTTLTPTATSTMPASSTPPGMVLIPAGKFLMGSNPDEVQQAADWCGCNKRRFEDELYIHEVYVSAFYIDKYEVTNRQFQAFADATGYKTDAEKKSEVNTWRTVFTDGKQEHPVVWMSWNDAAAYCQWAGKRLPTEAEWEKAARGTDGRLWPWGNEWDSTRLNMREGGRKATTQVGTFPQGASPYGMMDMAGNVWEWVNDWHDPAYYTRGQDRDPVGPPGGEDRVLRGGAFNNGIEDVRTANRHKGGMSGYAPDHGFRCAQ